VGTNYSCDNCGAVGHYSCGAGLSGCAQNFLYRSLYGTN
jgi:hypothetical protein